MSEDKNWKVQIQEYLYNAFDLHEVMERYLDLTGRPVKVPYSDIESIFLMSRIFKKEISNEELAPFVIEFMIYGGYAYQEDGESGEHFEKLKSRV
jgi:hypothetical protein